jgi:hypothetical protein
MTPTFRKSSYSDANGAQCVEIANTLDALRDSKNPATVLKINLVPLITMLNVESRWEQR